MLSSTTHLFAFLFLPASQTATLFSATQLQAIRPIMTALATTSHSRHTAFHKIFEESREPLLIADPFHQIFSAAEMSLSWTQDLYFTSTPTISSLPFFVFLNFEFYDLILKR